MNKIIASNFKTNHTRKSTREFIEDVNHYMLENAICNDVLIFPTSTSLDIFDTNKNLTIGVQNAYYTKNGSFTGEIGTMQLDEFEIKTILIGHSERRHILGETQKEVALKYNYYKSLGYKIIYCFGEPLEVKQAGLTETLGYIWEQFDGIDLSYDNLILAYEPVWAIGTGISATLEDIATIHRKIKKKIDKPLLYGGSVKVCGLQDILEVPNVDGVLVGTASWIVEDFKKMIYIASKMDANSKKINCTMEEK
ncbi:MAG: triose-phosphate isomerase [Arcobacter sp.]|nr:triose-phosphate isomerase [Arcobacter sp.]